MRSQIIISWGDGQVFPFDIDEASVMPGDLARHWLDQQFTALDCEPVRLTGKVLLADKVLAIAQAAGLSRFVEDDYRPWAKAFAQAVAALLGRPVVRIDIPSLTVSY